jgi:hypothetical protein
MLFYIYIYLYIFKVSGYTSATFELLSFKHIKSPTINTDLSCEGIRWDWEHFFFLHQAHINININILCKILFITLHNYHFKNLMWNDKKV